LLILTFANILGVNIGFFIDNIQKLETSKKLGLLKL
jgi:hypothetical protein